MRAVRVSVGLVLGSAGGAIAQHWPQPAGPQGDWSTRTATEIPTSFNLVSGENVLWTKPLEESGQSGIAVLGDRLFLTILKPFVPGQNSSKKTSGIRRNDRPDGRCIERLI